VRALFPLVSQLAKALAADPTQGVKNAYKLEPSNCVMQRIRVVQKLLPWTLAEIFTVQRSEDVH
jgi:hypothetical protein